MFFRDNKSQIFSFTKVLVRYLQFVGGGYFSPLSLTKPNQPNRQFCLRCWVIFLLFGNNSWVRALFVSATDGEVSDFNRRSSRASDWPRLSPASRGSQLKYHLHHFCIPVRLQKTVFSQIIENFAVWAFEAVTSSLREFCKLRRMPAISVELFISSIVHF